MLRDVVEVIVVEVLALEPEAEERPAAVVRKERPAPPLISRAAGEALVAGSLRVLLPAWISNRHVVGV